MTLYASLDDVRKEMNAENTVDDDEVLDGIEQISQRIDDLFASDVPFFAPYIEARDIPLDANNINSMARTFSLGTPLLSLTGVGINNQTLTVGTNVRAYPPLRPPYMQIQLLGDRASSWYRYGTCSDAWGSPFVTITGIWGFNRRYANAWLNTTTLTEAIDDEATHFTVATIEGPNSRGKSPALSPGHMIQIDTEWMDVIAADAVVDEMTDVTTNTLTVVRAVNGSTAAAHVDEAVISVYQVEPSIKRAVVRQTAVQYAKQGAFETNTISDFTTAGFPSDLLFEVKSLLALFANL